MLVGEPEPQNIMVHKKAGHDLFTHVTSTHGHAEEAGAHLYNSGSFLKLSTHLLAPCNPSKVVHCVPDTTYCESYI